jgi:Leucine-rich repeat (LRR) protein
MMYRWIFSVALLFWMSAATSATAFGAEPIHRRWTDAAGNEIDATLVDIDPAGLRLIAEKDHKPILLPLDKLSREDGALVGHLADPKQRAAIAKFSRSGSVGCDAKGDLKLYLSQSGATDHDLLFMDDLPDVAWIDLFECDITDAGLAPLTSLKKLRTLRLTDTKVKGPGLRDVAKIPNLETFEFSFNPTDAGSRITPHLDSLRELKNLKSLTIRSVKLTEPDLRTIGELSTLESLEFMGCDIQSPALEYLAGLTRLKALTIDGAFTDADGASLAKLPGLKKLVLTGAGFSAQAMQEIGKLKNLEVLTLPAGVKNDDLAAIEGLTNLKTLTLTGKDITVSALKHLAALKNLEELSLPENVSAFKYPDLAGLKKLRRLHFEGPTYLSAALELLVEEQGRSVTDAFKVLAPKGAAEERVDYFSNGLSFKLDSESLGYLAKLPDLKNLSLEGRVREDWFAKIGDIQGLEGLEIARPDEARRPIEISKKALHGLSKCRKLAGLSLTGCAVDESAFDELQALPDLTGLGLHDCTVEQGGYAAIGRLTALDQLTLDSASFHDADFRLLAQLKNLRYLTIDNQNQHDAHLTLKGLAELKGLKKLETIHVNIPEATFADFYQLYMRDFGRSPAQAVALILDVEHDSTGKITTVWWHADELKTTPDDLKVLDALPDLTTLGLPDDVTDEGMKHLANMKRLTELQFDSKHVTDAGMKALAGMESLERLLINFAPITDEGLKPLMGLRNLKDVRLHGTKATKAGVAALQRAFPSATIAGD